MQKGVSWTHYVLPEDMRLCFTGVLAGAKVELLILELRVIEFRSSIPSYSEIPGDVFLSD